MPRKCWLNAAAATFVLGLFASSSHARGLEELERAGAKAEVGHIVIELVLTGSLGERRPIDVHFWYPAEERSYRAAAATVYQYSHWVGIPLVISDAFEIETTSKIAREEPAIAPRGRYPLLLLSHGSGNTPSDYSYMAELVASFGYVIAAPTHTGNTLDDTIPDLVNQTAKRHNPGLLRWPRRSMH